MMRFGLGLFLLATVATAPWTAFSQPVQQETVVIERPEEYQLRLLESQIHMLRAKLYAQQKMTDEQKQQWQSQYNDVAKRLEQWNKFQGEFNIE